MTGWKCVNTPDTQTSPEATFKEGIPHLLPFLTTWVTMVTLLTQETKSRWQNSFLVFSLSGSFVGICIPNCLNPQIVTVWNLIIILINVQTQKHIHSTFQSNCKRRWKFILKNHTQMCDIKTATRAPFLTNQREDRPLVEVWKGQQGQHVGASCRASHVREWP